MSAEPNIARAAKSLKAKRQREPTPGHAEIVRMAAVEAASRAVDRREMIATAAYFRAQKRGFEPGHELEDWYAAENDIAEAQHHDLMIAGADTP
ncbi:DUF2934 domain-containing protein [Peristeroidobacter agariperforans]|uniref:DUF2934 domain-containing protein n=1 Tax=Peristeroidobacter agariperforans TaxID=268404 RepID=UPI0018E57795|nr:DUF2934 domain-containing protein [Peristeroidobacter agariperforans]